MRIFGRLFGGDARPSTSSVRVYAEAAYATMTPDTPIADGLRDSFLWSVSRFGQHQSDDGDAPDETFRKTREQYAGDLPLFEVSAFVLFLLDLWLFQKHPAHREKYFDAIFHDIRRTFGKALDVDVSAVLQSRVDTYGEMARAGLELDRWAWHLTQILSMSKAKRTPVEYDPSGPVVRADAFEQYWLTVNVRSLLPMVDGLMKILEHLIETGQRGKATP